MIFLTRMGIFVALLVLSLAPSAWAQASVVSTNEPARPLSAASMPELLAARYPIAAIDPTPTNNPAGNGFPGNRGGQQLVVYTARYAMPTTQTNEFGFEVTVVNGRVVALEGANSLIPQTSNAFVVSGHGKARQWILANLPLGAAVSIEEQQLVSHQDTQTEWLQLDALIRQIQELRPNRGSLPLSLQQEISALRLKALANPTADPSPEEQAQVSRLNAQLTQMLWASYPPLKANQARGIWHRPSEKSVAAIRQTLDGFQKLGINQLFLETYLHGDPIFPSQTFAEYGITQKLPFPVSDRPNPLKTWIEEAHARKIKVHAWFQVFYAGNVQYDQSKGSILAKYPEWANIQRIALDKPTLPPSTLEPGAYFLDPANPAVRKFLTDLIRETVTKYELDGFQFDYIRYPSSFPPDKYSYVNSTWGYTPTAREQFKTRYDVDPALLTGGDPLWQAWNDFKTEQVSQFVQATSAMLRQQRPKLVLSMAIFPKATDAVIRKHQDWSRWAQAKWVDVICPMTLTSATNVVAEDTRFTKTFGLPVWTGIFGPFNGSPAGEVLAQIQAAMANQADGVTLFDTAHLTPDMRTALAAGLFKPLPMLVPVVAPTLKAPVLKPLPPAMGKPSRSRWFLPQKRQYPLK